MGSQAIPFPQKRQMVVCPILTLGMLKPQEESRIASLAPEAQQVQVTPVECIRELCGFFVPSLSPTGDIVGGVCAVRILGATNAGIMNAAEQLVKAMDRAAKALDSIASDGFPLDQPPVKS